MNKKIHNKIIINRIILFRKIYYYLLINKMFPLKKYKEIKI